MVAKASEDIIVGHGAQLYGLHQFDIIHLLI